MKSKILLIIFSVLFFSSSTLYAKWWIFGGGEEEVGFDYLYVNALSFDDVSGVAVLPTSQLDKGLLHIRGKARSGKNKIGAVTVSLDGGKTWKKASFEKDGGFDFSFTPDTAQSYDIYAKVIDTSGRSNEVEDAHIKISFSDLDVEDTIQQTLAKLKTYYEQEDDINFMQYVSNNFEGDIMTLERALRKDFSALDNIQIDFSITSFAFSNNRYYASIYFNRSVEASDGTSYSDSGSTEFTFEIGEKEAMLLTMKNPLIFGLTYASDIASGTTASAQNSANFLTINNSGSVSEDTLANIDSGSGSDDDYASSGSFSLFTWCSPPCSTADGFNFSDDIKTTSIAQSEVYKESNILIPNAGVALYDYNADISINGITLPDTGYSIMAFADIGTVGNVIAAKLPNNTYAVMKVTNIAGSIIYFDYKYNPGGSRTFP